MHRGRVMKDLDFWNLDSGGVVWWRRKRRSTAVQILIQNVIFIGKVCGFLSFRRYKNGGREGMKTGGEEEAVMEWKRRQMCACVFIKNLWGNYKIGPYFLENYKLSPKPTSHTKPKPKLPGPTQLPHHTRNSQYSAQNSFKTHLKQITPLPH